MNYKATALELHKIEQDLVELETQFSTLKERKGRLTSELNRAIPAGVSFVLPELSVIMHVPPVKTGQAIVFKPVTVLG